MEVVVTGATGFIAGHLVEALAGHGHRVVAVGHDHSRLEALECVPGITAVPVDLRGGDLGVVLPAKVDAVVHLAQANVSFPAGARDMFAVNVASTHSLLAYACRAGACRFVLASSGSVYGPGDAAFGETNPIAGTDFYAATKIAAERLVLAYGGELATSVLRLFTPYGPGQSRRLVPSLVERIGAGRPVLLHPEGRPRLNPVWVGDVCSVIEWALGEPGSHLLNVAGPETVTVRQLAELIGTALDREPQFVQVEQPALGDFVGDIARLRAACPAAAHLRVLAEGIADVAAAWSRGAETAEA